jgi:thiamine-phosphate pyrophosphorylase
VSRRQTIPSRWLIIDRPADAGTKKSLRKLPLGIGVLVLGRVPPAQLRRLQRLAADRQLVIVREQRGRAARVHDMRELRQALLARAPLIFLSPIYPTSSHPEWRPIGCMRAAAMARLGGRKLVALGGMDDRRFERIRALGFVGWAGISAWKRRKPRT